MLLRITIRSACFGAIVDDATQCCIRVAPIGRWMRGKTLAQIAQWATAKGGTVERLP